MAKRFTDTDIWEQDWFIDLPSKYKLLWFYLKDKCDDCGVWRPNKSIIQKIIGEPINLDEFLLFSNVNEKTRVSVLPNGRWFLIEFFIFQYGEKLNPKSPVHKGALKRLINNNIHINQIPKLLCYNLKDADFEELRTIAYEKGIDKLLIRYGYPSDSPKDKDKDKDNKSIEDIEFMEIEKTNEDMVVVEMNKIWQKHNPGYTYLKEVDYPAFLQIAYYIADRKKIMRAKVVGENEKDILKSWNLIADFICNKTTDKFFKGLTIDGISIPRNLQKIEYAMTKFIDVPQQKQMVM